MGLTRLVRLFVRRQPRVEDANGIIKDPAFSALVHMNIRVRGRARVRGVWRAGGCGAGTETSLRRRTR